MSPRNKRWIARLEWSLFCAVVLAVWVFVPVQAI
jgi:hypothetical protein